MTKAKQVPKFKTEAAERAFWENPETNALEYTDPEGRAPLRGLHQSPDARDLAAPAPCPCSRSSSASAVSATCRTSR
jgi:hypothetical protein